MRARDIVTGLEFVTYADSRHLYVTCSHLMTLYESDVPNDGRMILQALHEHDKRTGCQCSHGLWIKYRREHPDGAY